MGLFINSSPSIKFWLSSILIFGSLSVIFIIYLPSRQSKKEKLEAEEENGALALNEQEPPNQREAQRWFWQQVLKDLEQVQLVRKDPQRDEFFTSEVIGLAQDVENSAKRISYFAARSALIEKLKSPEQLDKIENLIIGYLNTQEHHFAQAPMLVHFGLMAVGETSIDDNYYRAHRIYKAITEQLLDLKGSKDQEKIQASHLTDVYDLVRNVLRNNLLDKSETGFIEVTKILDALGVRENFLNNALKEQVKQAVVSVSDLENVESLEKLQDKLATWLN